MLKELAPRRTRKPLTRSQMMARIRSQNTVPEVLARRAVHALGIRFRKNVRDLPGKPDLANKTRRWAIFVHGCFWHFHQGCRLASSPKSNTAYWKQKLNQNRRRDAANIEALERLGYRVLIIWECDVRDGQLLTNALADFFPVDLSQRHHDGRSRLQEDDPASLR